MAKEALSAIKVEIEALKLETTQLEQTAAASEKSRKAHKEELQGVICSEGGPSKNLSWCLGVIRGLGDDEQESSEHHIASNKRSLQSLWSAQGHLDTALGHYSSVDMRSKIKWLTNFDLRMADG